MKFGLTTLVVLLSSYFALGQNVPIDFETPGNGATWNWTVFENDVNPLLEIIVNPDPSGINKSCTVAKFTSLVAGRPYAGVESLHGAGIGSWTVTDSTDTIRIMVWKSVISDVGIKLVRSDNWSLGEIKIANTVTDEWEEIIFDFSANIGNTYDQIVIFPDFQARTTDNISYFDHIYGDASTSGGCGCTATETAPVPDSVDLADVEGTCSVDSLVPPTATDSCGETVFGTHNAVLPITTRGSTIVTWTYTDRGGNDTTQLQNVVIRCANGFDDIQSSKFSIHPNPSKGFVTIATKDAFEGQIVLRDLLGRELKRLDVNSNETVLDLRSLPSKGIYFTELVDANGSTLEVKKVIYE